MRLYRIIHFKQDDDTSIEKITGRTSKTSKCPAETKRNKSPHAIYRKKKNYFKHPPSTGCFFSPKLAATTASANTYSPMHAIDDTEHIQPRLVSQHSFRHRNDALRLMCICPKKGVSVRLDFKRQPRPPRSEAPSLPVCSHLPKKRSDTADLTK